MQTNFKRNYNNNVITLLLTLFLSLLSTASYADIPGVATDGGIQVGTATDPYWFNISGVLKLDERQYFDDTAATQAQYYNAVGVGTYRSGAFVRDAGLTFTGGVGTNFTYTLELNFQAQARLVQLDDAYVTYWGLRKLLPNFTFSIGQVNPGFCLNCAESSKWIPFLERNMSTNVFGPQQGMGISGNTYNKNYSLTVAITQQPKAGSFSYMPVFPSGANAILNTAGIIRKRDLWQISGRFTYAPINCTGRVLQFGLSAHMQEYSNTGLRYTTNAEMRSNNTQGLLDTAILAPIPGKAGTNSILISALNQKTIDLEFLGVYGPWSGEAEYQQVWINRGKWNPPGAPSTVYVTQGQNLSFNGYHAQISYILTGETRPLKISNGTLNKITPCHSYGAWEVSLRYSFITLNDKDIYGGLAHNTSGSLGWYANKNIKAVVEYVYSRQKRDFPVPSVNNLGGGPFQDHRTVSSIGARLQVVF